MKLFDQGHSAYHWQAKENDLCVLDHHALWSRVGNHQFKRKYINQSVLN